MIESHPESQSWEVAHILQPEHKFSHSKIPSRNVDTALALRFQDMLNVCGYSPRRGSTGSQMRTGQVGVGWTGRALRVGKPCPLTKLAPQAVVTSSFFTASEASGVSSLTHFLSPSTRCSMEMPRVFRRSFSGSRSGRASRGKGKTLSTGRGKLLMRKAVAAEQKRSQVRAHRPPLYRWLHLDFPKTSASGPLHLLFYLSRTFLHQIATCLSSSLIWSLLKCYILRDVSKMASPVTLLLYFSYHYLKY